MINRDIREVSSNEIASYLPNGKVDVIIGGPPCQGFSTIGKRVSSDPEKRYKHDPRNELVLTYAKLIRELRPKFIVMENVKGILTLDDGAYLQNVLSLLKDAGYQAEFKLINMADFGVPEIRERVIIIGNRLGMDVEFPTPDHSDNPEDDLPAWNNCWDVIKDLEFPIIFAKVRKTSITKKKYKTLCYCVNIIGIVFPCKQFRRKIRNSLPEDVAYDHDQYADREHHARIHSSTV